jgi:myo-inositol-1(or 4)-monophosphatase
VVGSGLPECDRDAVQPLWDVTAGLLLVREAGGVVFDHDGSDHCADSVFTLASEPALAEPIRQLVAAAM